MTRWLSGGPAPDLLAAAGFAVRIAATVVTRFGARPGPGNAKSGPVPPIGDGPAVV
jgi:sugar/nucleoside kinase (ribokinase family)